jgi:phytoene synthase
MTGLTLQPSPPAALPATPLPSRQTDLAACAALLKGGSRTFFAASLLLPPSVRAPAAALYAFCRLADDAIDLQDDKVSALAALRERLARAYAGRPAAIPADRALAEVVAAFAIPRALPEALLEGLAWDSAFRTYPGLADLHAYAARVAGTVGVMMALVMGTREPAALARAADLGVAMQLTNIARDVGEDLRAGRLYLPLDWLRAAGIDPEELMRTREFSPALGRVVARLLAEADRLYARAETGIAALPAGCRPGIAAARFIYAEIGRAVERAGLDSVSRRAVVPGSRKAALLARSLAVAVRPRALDPAPPLAANRFLVEAVGPAPRRPARLRYADRVAWVIDLFTELERREVRARADAWNARSAAARQPS